MTNDDKLFAEKAKKYVLCFSNDCQLHQHCLHWLVGQHADHKARLVTTINPLRDDKAEGKCHDFRSDKKRRMARGMRHFYDEIPEAKAKAIRSDIIAAYYRALYYHWVDGSKPVKPDDQEQIAVICRAHGWTTPPVFDSYYDEYDFDPAVS